MQFRLRTLLIVLAVGPVVFARVITLVNAMLPKTRPLPRNLVWEEPGRGAMSVSEFTASRKKASLPP
jgi:hypothetical protein